MREGYVRKEGMVDAPGIFHSLETLSHTWLSHHHNSQQGWVTARVIFSVLYF